MFRQFAAHEQGRLAEVLHFRAEPDFRQYCATWTSFAERRDNCMSLGSLDASL